MGAMLDQRHPVALREPDHAKRIRYAALLLQRMQRCGVSRWHPDPVGECERVEAEKQRRAAQ